MKKKYLLFIGISLAILVIFITAYFVIFHLNKKSVNKTRPVYKNTSSIYGRINPNGRIIDANNTAIENNIQIIYKAIETYQVDSLSQYPAGIPHPISGHVIKSTPAYGFSIINGQAGTPYCVVGSSPKIDSNISISKGVSPGDCEEITPNSSIYVSLEPYLSSFPRGNYYVGENISGNKIIVFSTGYGNALQKGININSLGYSIAWIYN